MPDPALDPLSDAIRVPVEDGLLVAEASTTGIPALCLHAGVCDRRSWRPVAAHLPEYRVIAHDRRGFGDTTSTAPTVDHVADTIAVLDHLGVDRALVVGNSMGGAVAQHLALEHPDRVAGLVLVASAWPGAPYPDDPDDLAQIEQRWRAADAAGDTDEVNRIEAHVWLDGPRSPEGRVSGTLRDLFLDMNGRALALEATTGEEIERVPPWDRLPSLDLPVAVVVGELDEPSALEVSQLAAERIPHATFEILEAVAHLPGLECPDRLARAIQELEVRTR